MGWMGLVSLTFVKSESGSMIISQLQDFLIYHFQKYKLSKLGVVHILNHPSEGRGMVLIDSD